MRKRIVIGLLILSAIGIAVFFFSQPKKGTVEWHKREYVGAWKRLHQETLMDDAKRFVYWIAGGRSPVIVRTGSEYGAFRAQVHSNRCALINYGYVCERTFYLTNSSAVKVFSTQSFRDAWRNARREFLDAETPGTNVIAIMATREDMTVFADAIRKADVP